MGSVTFDGVVGVTGDDGKPGEVDNTPTDDRVFRRFLGGDTTDVSPASREGESRLRLLSTDGRKDRRACRFNNETEVSPIA
eukprot:scaffold85483_cov31-Attheya_sp.AAC.1